jgi:glycosyltransferase involved in cell wall biosynthesis
MDANRAAWLLSAYRSDSHAAWADWLCDEGLGLAWRRLELPGRHFRWRIRGNPLSWLEQLPPEDPAALVATSMVDLATLRGLHPRLGRAATLYYFHENQFAYPRSAAQHDSVDPQMVQLYGALAADLVAFNSAYNRDAFLAGVDRLLARLPDQVPGGIVERLAAKSRVCAVAVEPIRAREERDPRLILWNHRWEYDKDPNTFADALHTLAHAGTAFRLALLGRRPRQAPAALRRLRERFRSRIVLDGAVDRETYRQALGRAAVVVSTARHEFQGLAVLEAVSAGARPLVPDALCYREQYPDRYRYPPGDADALARRLRDWLDGVLPPPADAQAWTSARLRPRWQALLDETVAVRHDGP